MIIATIATVRAAANAFLRRELRANDLGDIAPSHGGVLYSLVTAERRTMGDIAARIRRSKATTTALVNGLERMGYVESVEVAGDARIRMIQLTPKGRELIPVFVSISENLNRVGLKGLSVEDKRELQKYLQTIISNFEWGMTEDNRDA
ncbi:MAG: MarR family transcriptional regulator [Thermoleophilia bacterium]|nr:MarR family transcriptional regulator [Thermoleophilia bacterium]